MKDFLQYNSKIHNTNLFHQQLINPLNNNFIQSQTSKYSNTLLKMEAIRINSYQKQKNSTIIWEFTPQELQHFFFNYPLDQNANFNLNDLLNSPRLKLIRDKNKIYFGQVFQHRKHGKGIVIYRDGRIYEGQFSQNQKQGIGYDIQQNGNTYIGQIQKNKKHGLGTMYWFNFTTQDSFQFYDGEWWAGFPSGNGYYLKANGDIYQGQFKNGLKHGQGYQKFSNGDFYIGQYSNGFPEGYGQYFWSDGSSYKGDFKQGLRNGYGVWRKNKHKNNQNYKGHYMLDQRSGYGVYKWNQNNYYKGHFFEDQRHGQGQLYHDNQLIYKGMWQYGERVQDVNYISKSLMILPSKSDLYQRQVNLFPPIPSKYILMPMNIPQNPEDVYPIIYRLPKIVQPIIEQQETRPIKPKAKSNRKTLDMERIHRLAQSNHSITRCGHKNCIPQHYWNRGKRKEL